MEVTLSNIVANVSEIEQSADESLMILRFLSSRHAVILTFDLLSLNICRTSDVMCSNCYQIGAKSSNPRLS